MAQRLDRVFFWVDLEMTGLNPEEDQILEIASFITDTDLNFIAQGPHYVIHQPDEALAKMIPKVRDLHQASGLTEAVRASTITLEYAEQHTLSFIKSYCKIHSAIMAGNSVWQDARFLQYYMPTITRYLHYRIMDVSSIKELVQVWYPHDAHRDIKKRDLHRALPDIEESLAELKHYRKHFFKPQS